MPLNSNALTSLANLKDQIEIAQDFTSNDAKLEKIINAASAYIQSYCMRVLVAENKNELHSGRRSNFIITNEYPINAVTSIHIDNDRVFDDSSLVNSSDYTIIDENESIAFDFTLPPGLNNIKVVYNAGYSVIPTDLEYGCLILSEWYYRLNSRQDIGRNSKSKMNESTSIINEVPKVVLQLIEKYKRTEIPNSPIPIRNY